MTTQAATKTRHTYMLANKNGKTKQWAADCFITEQAGDASIVSTSRWRVVGKNENGQGAITVRDATTGKILYREVGQNHVGYDKARAVCDMLVDQL